MPKLIELPFSFAAVQPIDTIIRLLEAGDALRHAFETESGPDRIGGFRGMDGLAAWSALTEVKASILDHGTTFCEWGCGIGMVACIAEKLGWEATGLDIEARLVDAANAFAKSHDCDARFHVGSYKPNEGCESAALPNTQDQRSAPGLFDFDVIYAYTWPAEVEAVTQFVADHGRPGSLFLRYRGGKDFKVFRVSL